MERYTTHEDAAKCINKDCGHVQTVDCLLDGPVYLCLNCSPHPSQKIWTGGFQFLKSQGIVLRDSVFCPKCKKAAGVVVNVSKVCEKCEESAVHSVDQMHQCNTCGQNHEGEDNAGACCNWS